MDAAFGGFRMHKTDDLKRKLLDLKKNEIKLTDKSIFLVFVGLARRC